MGRVPWGRGGHQETNHRITFSPRAHRASFAPICPPLFLCTLVNGVRHQISASGRLGQGCCRDKLDREPMGARGSLKGFLKVQIVDPGPRVQEAFRSWAMDPSPRVPKGLKVLGHGSQPQGPKGPTGPGPWFSATGHQRASRSRAMGSEGRLLW